MTLLEPLDLGPIRVPNRVLVPAMVTRLSGEDGFVNDSIIDRYVRYATGHVGLIVVEATAIHQSKSGPLLRLSDDAFTPGHAELVRRVRDAGPSKIVPQIIHFLKVARSGWRQTIDSLSPGEIDAIVTDFADAAARAQDAGYDGVELHSAHAYTLSSFLSARNPRRDGYDGRTLEGRLALFGRVYHAVRARVGSGFGVGARFLAEECIKDGYTVEDAKRIALRMAMLGVDYISLSVGGKFEDAVHREGQPLYPYTGYSGDRCMPGDAYPPLPHAHLAAAIKQYVNQHGYTVPIASVGKISDPNDAERLVATGQADLIGMARQLLADPDWVKKVAQNRSDEVLRCIYCNVCKQLDENFKEVHCFLWPKGARQAPADQPGARPPDWAAPDVTVEQRPGEVRLRWRRAGGDVAGYDVWRSEAGAPFVVAEAVKGTQFVDRKVLGGLTYRYFVRAYDAVGRQSAPTDTLTVAVPAPVAFDRQPVATADGLGRGE
ncbi:MAG: NADH:flavin oxidoreductase [Alphaproteobacteria bacterium]|nr:NADH:flavin oxidoreductase [Alphaproteobacteria bacterium]